MNTVTISSKYQITIPRNICDSMEIRPGEKVQVLQYENRIKLVPLKKLKAMRGFLKGIDTTVTRDKDKIYYIIKNLVLWARSTFLIG